MFSWKIYLLEWVCSINRSYLEVDGQFQLLCQHKPGEESDKCEIGAAPDRGGGGLQALVDQVQLQLRKMAVFEYL